MDIYSLFGLNQDASSLVILEKCKSKLEQWTFQNVISKLNRTIDNTSAAVNAKSVYEEGERYLKTSATMLLDPQARQCYDAYLDCLIAPNSEKILLTRARILWFNSIEKNPIKFSKKMVESIKEIDPKIDPEIDPKIETKIETGLNPAKRQKLATKPLCRQCRGQFDFGKDYLVLHCDCSTRCGHTECMKTFKERVKGKCPVCRKTLLLRHQISKYLFWQHKEKFKFIT